MTPNFADRLAAAITEKQSQVCVGLDPRLESMPEPLLERYRREAVAGREAVAACLEDFSAGVLAAVEPYVVAVKLQLACFEQYGPPGMAAFGRLCGLASSLGLLVIADAKRGDVGISAAGYAAAYLGRPRGLSGDIDGYGADAMTINPLFGSDGVQPFLNDCVSYGKGVFVLVKTSNPGSEELQDLAAGTDGRPFFEQVADLVREWGRDNVGREGYSSVGAVVGATQAGALSRLRELLPQAFFLLPGYGAQGATAADVSPAFDRRGLGAIVSASRSIIYAGSDDGYADAAAGAARKMKDELWAAAR